MSRSPFTQDMIAVPKITVQEFSCLAIQVEGTITAGKITVQASISGRAPVTLPLENVHDNSAIDADTGITAAGIYRASVSGLPQAEVVLSDDLAFDGVLYVTAYQGATNPPTGT